MINYKIISSVHFFFPQTLLLPLLKYVIAINADNWLNISRLTLHVMIFFVN